MSGSSQQPWSDGPNAPKVPRFQYVAERDVFIGGLTGAMFYGFVVALFFQCMYALLNPVHGTSGRIKWGLAVHTAAMFSFATINAGMSLDLQSFSYVEKRSYSGYEGLYRSGPLGYLALIYSKPISVVPPLMFFLGNWLADGLLLYRCHMFYSMNYWAIAFPSLMYIASMAMGIMLIYQSSRPESNLRNPTAIFDFAILSYSISLSLNVLLTLMIVARLILHDRKFRKAMGAPATTGGLYNSIVTVLVESSALYAVSVLLFIGLWASNNSSANVFSPILAGTQVIASFLIILRVANRTALTSRVIASGDISTIRFQTASVSETLSGETPVSMDAHEETPGERGVEIEETIAEVPS